VRQRPGSSGVTLVALSGWGQEEDRRRSRDAGMDYHMVKPLDLEELTRLLMDAAPEAARNARPS
jgi:DNA-binding response OmpR family regulator